MEKHYKPKISLLIHNNLERIYIRRSLIKTQKFIKNKAKYYLNLGYLITINVKYNDGMTNSGTYTKLEDLKWAYNSFVKEYE